VYNLLNGTIPSWVFSLPLLISFLSLGQNQFSGLPDELKTNPALIKLDLSHNQLSGSFPQITCESHNLYSLDLSSNNITLDAGTHITFPSLAILSLSSCELKDFPHLLKNVKTLEFLDISNNKIRGQIPDWFSSMRWDSLWFLIHLQDTLSFAFPSCEFLFFLVMNSVAHFLHSILSLAPSFSSLNIFNLQECQF
ncbi:hypothetical protein H5410_057266, partial [Solanum commersonii]